MLVIVFYTTVQYENIEWFHPLEFYLSKKVKCPSLYETENAVDIAVMVGSAMLC